MILDKGFCSIYSVTNTGSPGAKPVEGLSLKYQSWYGELDFANVPFNTDERTDIEISARIRIHQNRGVSNNDILILSNVLPPASTAESERYKIVRAYHGTDDENGQPITDLSLVKVVQSI